MCGGVCSGYRGCVGVSAVDIEGVWGCLQWL